MTTETVEREPALYITDAELIRRMGVPEKIAELRNCGENRCAGESKSGQWLVPIAAESRHSLTRQIAAGSGVERQFASRLEAWSV